MLSVVVNVTVRFFEEVFVMFCSIDGLIIRWRLSFLPPLRPEKMKAERPSFFLGPHARAAGEPEGLKGGKSADQQKTPISRRQNTHRRTLASTTKHRLFESTKFNFLHP
jgi:hypothetical protein